jgi:hypothetical protein
MRNFISPRLANLTGSQRLPLHARNYIVDLGIHGHDHSEMQQSHRPVIMDGRAMTARKDRQP